MYHIFDGETENRKYYGRFASPWHPENYMVAHGWKNEGDPTCSFSYQRHKLDRDTYEIPETATTIVGHNLRFDLTWVWKHPTFKAFIERGGLVWDTQYAEYLLQGQDDEYQMCKLDVLAPQYGGTNKIDAVKAMWDDGFLTSEVPKDLLIDYLIGTEEEGYNAGDVGNTEKIYLGQLKRAEELGMMPIIKARMDGYLATTEMEMNGININMGIALNDMVDQQDTARELMTTLTSLIPDVGIPDKCDFSWTSPLQVSAILFGGYIKYSWSDVYMDEETGELARTQIDVPHYYMEDGSLAACDAVEGNPKALELVVTYKSGKRKGARKSKKVKMKRGKIKTKRFEKMVKFPRQVEPMDEWKGKATDALDKPVYSTGAEVVEMLQSEENLLIQTFSKWKRTSKVLDTYYMKTNTKFYKDGSPHVTKHSGMLTFVKPDGILNHHLNHCSTITGRMSSSNPNLQNIPRGDTSIVKRMFTSRFDEGVVIEADYSQLEVVENGYLTKDPNLIRDLKAGVDFHCKHVALKNHIPYEEAYDLCKVKKEPKWKSERTKCKGYTFQSEYGAGIRSIAKATGMTEDEVKGIKEAVALEYPIKTAFADTVKAEIERTAVPYNIKLPMGGFYTIQKGFWIAPTGSRYAFRSERAPKWLQEKGIDQTFKPTKIKNYPTQGTGGETMQVQVGRLFRECVKRGWWSGNTDSDALLVNTVHDCAWGDCRESVYQEFGKLIQTTLESVPSTYKELFNVDVGVQFPVDVEYGRNMLELGHELS